MRNSRATYIGLTYHGREYAPMSDHDIFELALKELLAS